MTDQARIAIFMRPDGVRPPADHARPERPGEAERARREPVRGWLEAHATVLDEPGTDQLVDGHDVAVVDAARVPAIVAAIRARNADIPVIALVQNADAGIGAIRAGAYDIVCDPLDRDRLQGAVRRAHERQELQRRCRALQRQLEGDEIVPLRELERRAIEKALAATRGSVEKAARMLGMGRATLYRRLATMGTSRTSDA